jgi:glutamate/tyrosine decarboxylase-like PLP-dependent enzyme
MLQFGTWLMSLAAPLAKQVLIALGIGAVTYAGLQALLGAAQTQVLNNWGQMTGATAQLVGYFGFGQAVSIILGGMAAKGALMAVGHYAKIA